jgi:hypothetical protein
MSALRALLSDILDYAGLFPPAALDAPVALGQYAAHRAHPHAWMLGRFVLPASLLGEVPLPDRVTLVVKGENVELPELPPQVESVEVAGSLARDPGRRVFHEIDWRGDFESNMPASGGVKLRTGGLTLDAIPPALTVVRFLQAAARRRLPVKFTAGLHVPVPNDDPAVSARMHGFLNILAVALAAYRGDGGEQRLASLLSEAGYDDFQFTRTHFHAGPLSFKTEDVARLRERWVTGIGSCSFLEPVEHLERHGFLQHL